MAIIFKFENARFFSSALKHYIRRAINFLDITLVVAGLVISYERACCANLSSDRFSQCICLECYIKNASFLGRLSSESYAACVGSCIQAFRYR